MPSWSWLSLRGGDISYHQDPDAYSQDRSSRQSRMATTNPDVHIWHLKETSSWLSFPPSITPESTMIPFFTPDLLVSTRVVSVATINKFVSFASEYTVSVATAAQTNSQTQVVKVALDCRDLQLEKRMEIVGSVQSPGWRLALINEHRLWEGHWDAEDDKVNAEAIDGLGRQYQTFLAVEQVGKCVWRRIGIAEDWESGVDVASMRLERFILV